MVVQYVRTHTAQMKKTIFGEVALLIYGYPHSILRVAKYRAAGEGGNLILLCRCQPTTQQIIAELECTYTGVLC